MEANAIATTALPFRAWLTPSGSAARLEVATWRTARHEGRGAILQVGHASVEANASCGNGAALPNSALPRWRAGGEARRVAGAREATRRPWWRPLLGGRGTHACPTRRDSYEGRLILFFPGQSTRPSLATLSQRCSMPPAGDKPGEKANACSTRATQEIYRKGHAHRKSTGRSTRGSTIIWPHDRHTNPQPLP